MVSISSKQPTARTAKAVCSIQFSSNVTTDLIRENALKKGDVLGVARIAGIMAAKSTPNLIPLCHPITISKVAVDLVVVDVEDDDGDSIGGRVDIEATVSCEGKTGVEMEALTAASAAALTVYDMCKAVDKGMVIGGLKVVMKEGGKSGTWVEGVSQGDSEGGRSGRRIEDEPEDRFEGLRFFLGMATVFGIIVAILGYGAVLSARKQAQLVVWEEDD